MNKYLIKLTYDGRNFSGYQVQNNARTVGGELLEALKKVFGTVENLAGCSRTDSGVHAKEYYASFSSERLIPNESVPSALNANLPRDIAILECTTPDADFHARYSVKEKEYVYKIYTNKIRIPFFEGLAYHYPKEIDINFLNNEAKALIGTHDFASFMAAGSDIKDTVRTVFSAYFRKTDENFYEFVISADGFLYNMVRIITGTLLAINEGKLRSGTLPEIIEGKNRAFAGPTAPPQGLYLSSVKYK